MRVDTILFSEVHEFVAVLIISVFQKDECTVFSQHDFGCDGISTAKDCRVVSYIMPNTCLSCLRVPGEERYDLMIVPV